MSNVREGLPSASNLGISPRVGWEQVPTSRFSFPFNFHLFSPVPLSLRTPLMHSYPNSPSRPRTERFPVWEVFGCWLLDQCLISPSCHRPYNSTSCLVTDQKTPHPHQGPNNPLLAHLYCTSGLRGCFLRPAPTPAPATLSRSYQVFWNLVLQRLLECCLRAGPQQASTRKAQARLQFSPIYCLLEKPGPSSSSPPHPWCSPGGPGAGRAPTSIKLL